MITTTNNKKILIYSINRVKSSVIVILGLLTEMKSTINRKSIEGLRRFLSKSQCNIYANEPLYK